MKQEFKLIYENEIIGRHGIYIKYQGQHYLKKNICYLETLTPWLGTSVEFRGKQQALQDAKDVFYKGATPDSKAYLFASKYGESFYDYDMYLNEIMDQLRQMRQNFIWVEDTENISKINQIIEVWSNVLKLVA